MLGFHLVAPDNLDLVPGGAWHDGLTDPPQ